MTDIEYSTRLQAFAHKICQKTQSTPTLRLMLGDLLSEMKILFPDVGVYKPPDPVQPRHT